MAVTTWDELDKGLKPTSKDFNGTCDENCDAAKSMHSPRCALRTLVDYHRYSVKRAIAMIEDAIEIEAVRGDYYDPFMTGNRRYNPDTANDEEVKKYKHLMTLLKTATYDYCDCGAKHDGAGHYHWCSTQRDEPKKKLKLRLDDIPF